MQGVLAAGAAAGERVAVMDWFRWHHGTVRDEKFGLVARKSGASVAEVLAVWAYLLEAASTNGGDRGNVGTLDFEAIDFALGMADGRANAVVLALYERGMLEESGRLTAWSKRQVKREDEGAAERKRKQRDKLNVAPSPALSRNVTQRHDRREERRVQRGEQSAPSEPGALALFEQQGVPAPSAQGIVSRETWLTWYAEQWPHGKLPFGQAGKVLKAVIAEVGEAKAKQAWVAYCRSVAGTPQFFSLAKFGQTFRAFLGANGSGPVSAALDAKLDAIFGDGDGGEAIEV